MTINYLNTMITEANQAQNEGGTPTEKAEATNPKESLSHTVVTNEAVLNNDHYKIVEAKVGRTSSGRPPNGQELVGDVCSMLAKIFGMNCNIEIDPKFMRGSWLKHTGKWVIQFPQTLEPALIFHQFTLQLKGEKVEINLSDVMDPNDTSKGKQVDKITWGTMRMGAYGGFRVMDLEDGMRKALNGAGLKMLDGALGFNPKKNKGTGSGTTEFAVNFETTQHTVHDHQLKSVHKVPVGNAQVDFEFCKSFCAEHGLCLECHGTTSEENVMRIKSCTCPRHYGLNANPYGGKKQKSNSAGRSTATFTFEGLGP